MHCLKLNTTSRSRYTNINHDRSDSSWWKTRKSAVGIHLHHPLSIYQPPVNTIKVAIFHISIKAYMYIHRLNLLINDLGLKYTCNYECKKFHCPFFILTLIIKILATCIIKLERHHPYMFVVLWFLILNFYWQCFFYFPQSHPRCAWHISQLQTRVHLPLFYHKLLISVYHLNLHSGQVCHGADSQFA